ncbi:MAG: pilus assembly protein PilM [Candidatus Parabeggiatoa sp. nov. 3]|jgi:type IV pilus assembly protein PilM|nr:MAG: pilus assembly protein PilM [Gammaproteobacteria bacterium]RKZ62891.1 MAG: pilus assembly protein PilM [Gammaproteobacteria bacterium]RKZ83805.1 MAG: pilus assembly protein PilM [Gammaproteobacteria bacterium]HEW98183.1 pilus assembly protein PilM [Beggiatoa sp.]
MSLFSLKSDQVVGIDISSTAVKLLELSQAGKGYKVESYAIEPLQEKAVEDKNIVDMEIVGNAIDNAVKRAKPRAQHAAVAVAGPSVITKMTTMDGGMSDEDMKQAIETDPATYLGQEVEDVHLDWKVIGPNEKEPERFDVLVAACRDETVEACITVLDMGGLKAKVVDIEKYALENALTMIAQNDPEINDGETIALIEVGATTTSMSVLGKKKSEEDKPVGESEIVYTHEEMFGGKQLTDQIIARYELNYEEANLAKRDGGLPEDYETEILEPFKVEMALQISRMVQYYYAQSSYGKLSHILIAGGCAAIPGIIEQISNKVGGHITIANPFASMSIASRVSKKSLMNDAPALMIACGLALRTFDEH